MCRRPRRTQRACFAPVVETQSPGRRPVQPWRKVDRRRRNAPGESGSRPAALSAGRPVHALLDCVLLRVSPDHIRPHLRADLLDRAVDDLESLYAEGRHAPGDPDTPWPPNARLLSNLMAILSLTARLRSRSHDESGESNDLPLVELRLGDQEGQGRECAPASVLDGRGDAVQ